MRTTTISIGVVLLLALPTMATAGHPIELVRGASPQEPQQPQIAIDAKGTIHVVLRLGSGVDCHLVCGGDLELL